MKKILILFGTRPEAIKMAPVIKELIKLKNIETKICVTGQHKEMLNQVLEFFQIKPDYDLQLMKPNQNLNSLTADILMKLKPILDDFCPDLVFVHGDTTTSMAGALASFYNGAKVCHVEAGLRTNDIYSPFPEELNRQITSKIATFHFSPTIEAQSNLLKENIKSEKIIVTGNTVIDALLESKKILSSYENDEIKK